MRPPSLGNLSLVQQARRVLATRSRSRPKTSRSRAKSRSLATTRLLSSLTTMHPWFSKRCLITPTQSCWEINRARSKSKTMRCWRKRRCRLLSHQSRMRMPLQSSRSLKDRLPRSKYPVQIAREKTLPSSPILRKTPEVPSLLKIKTISTSPSP